MAVRPFYMDADIDGAARKSGGLRAKDGGVSIIIRQRDRGVITDAFTIHSSSRMVEGKLMLETVVYDENQIVARKITEY